MGGDSNNNTIIFAYRYLLKFWQLKTYIYYGLLQFQTILWDNTSVTTTFDISNKNLVDISLVSSFSF